MFPRMPREVFDACFEPALKAYGWPFLAVEDVTNGTRWEKFFGSCSLLQWSEFRWERGTAVLRLEQLHPRTRNAIDAIIRTNTLAEKTDANTLLGTRERFSRCLNYIQQTGLLPAPVVGAPTAQGLLILDGYHRLAALVHAGKAEGFDLPMWLALTDEGMTQNELAKQNHA